MADEKLVKHEYGFYSLEVAPSVEDIEKIYRDEYYQESDKHTKAYSKSYTPDELIYFKNRALVASRIYSMFSKKIEGSVLDIGCGEGFFSKYFHDNGWNVSLCDFSKDGINRFNEDLIKFFTQGNIYDILDELNKKDSKYDYINLDQVIFIVNDPVLLLQKVKSVMHKDSLFRVTTGNNFSKFTNFLKDNNFIDDKYVISTDVINYFNFDNLENTLKELGFKIFLKQADFPIEMYLANNHSNYYKNNDIGKGSHNARVLIDNHLVKQNVDEYIKLMECSANLDYGRLAMFYVTL